jgi:hypothetical protein
MRTLTPCGTPGAYRRHYQNGEKPCDVCRAGHAARKPRRAQEAIEIRKIDHRLRRLSSLKLIHLVLALATDKALSQYARAKVRAQLLDLLDTKGTP